MTHADVLHHFRVRLFALADELGNVRAACRMLGVHPSTYDRWRKPMLRWGLDALRPRERRAPQMPNRTPLWEEAQILAVALAHPGWGPDRLAAELRRPRWGGHRRSPHGVWGVLRRAGLNTRAKRLGLIAGYPAPPEPQRRRPEPVRHIEATYPGDLVQVDCFYVGNLAGSRGRTWQYTAIDVASSYTWATLHNTPRTPSARHTAALVQHVARDLARRGWRLDRVSTDNSGEFTSATFTDALQAAGIRHTRIAAGRPQSNGCVERVPQTILEEGYRPPFARALVPRFTALRTDPARYLRYYTDDRAHTGRRTQGRTPAHVLGAAKMWPRCGCSGKTSVANWSGNMSLSARSDMFPGHRHRSHPRS